MQNTEEKTLSRREFLRLAAMVAGAVAVTGSGFVVYRQTRSNALSAAEIARLNPAFRVNEISASEVELFTHLGDGKVLKHRFHDLEADLLREIANEHPIEPLVTTLAQKHHLAVEVCRDKINQSLQEFEDAKLVYYGEKMLVKIVEAQNAR